MKQTIGKVARALGLKPKTIRYYEEAGVVPGPSREPGGWLSMGRRIYDEKAIERLRFVKQARELDFSLIEIRRLLDSYESGPPCGCSARPVLRVLVERKIGEVDHAINGLKDLSAELKALHGRVVALEGKTPAQLPKRIRPTPVDALFGSPDEPTRGYGKGRKQGA
jgi:DNA-binding transcriptional MerR regulator